jgi:hypothetical protein
LQPAETFLNPTCHCCQLLGRAHCCRNHRNRLRLRRHGCCWERQQVLLLLLGRQVLLPLQALLLGAQERLRLLGQSLLLLQQVPLYCWVGSQRDCCRSPPPLLLLLPQPSLLPLAAGALHMSAVQPAVGERELLAR